MLNFANDVLLPQQNVFSRPVEVTPYASQPGEGPYGNRGIYITTPIDVMTEANVVFSDKRTMLRIRLADYPIPPMPRDWLFIPAHLLMPDAGPFEVQNVDEYADGMALLTLRKAHEDEPRPVILPP
jgi:hypothetical protein